MHATELIDLGNELLPRRARRLIGFLLGLALVTGLGTPLVMWYARTKGVKIAVFNEEQLRMWHAATGKGPANHPLLQPGAPDWGYRNLTQEEAEVIDARHLLHLVAGAGSPDATLERAIVEVKQAS